MFGIGIVLYYPDYLKIEETVEKLLGKGCKILIYDNTPETSDGYYNHRKAIIEICDKFNIDYMSFKKNNGVAKAYNDIMKYYDGKVEYVLTLDQDTIVPSNLVESYKNNLYLESIGILCPNIRYKNDNSKFSMEGVDKVQSCISSGSLISINAWRTVGGFDESLFIDFVDFDFNYSLSEHGFNIYRINNVIINHELGDLCTKRLLNRKIMVTNHSPLRKFYLIRNIIICNKKHKEIYTNTRMMKDLIHNYIKALLFERNKMERIKMMNKGLIEGLKYRVVD